MALARPLGSMQMQESERRGVDILFAIDTSRSMLTPDVKPNRLTRAKLAVEDLLDHLSGDGVGLVAFAGEAFLQAPVTTDYDAFRETLESLDTPYHCAGRHGYRRGDSPQRVDAGAARGYAEGHGADHRR